jgi:hypothetical protein
MIKSWIAPFAAGRQSETMKSFGNFDQKFSSIGDLCWGDIISAINPETGSMESMIRVRIGQCFVGTSFWQIAERECFCPEPLPGDDTSHQKPVGLPHKSAIL